MCAMPAALQGLRTVIYPSPDLDAAKTWWTGFLGFGPYFDEPFYVGFNVGGYELGLLPNADLSEGALTYWGVADVAKPLSVKTVFRRDFAGQAEVLRW